MESISGHRCERTNVAVKCGMSMNCSKNFIGICKSQTWLLNKEYLKDHGCDRTAMAYKCQIFEAVSWTIHAYFVYIHMCV